MNNERTCVLRRSLEEGLRKLAKEREALIIPLCADENEFASLYERANVTLIFMQRTQQRLLNLEQSIATLKYLPHSGCMDCGKDIPQRRLEAQPDAVRCIACQEELENEQKRSHPALNKYGCQLQSQMGA